MITNSEKNDCATVRNGPAGGGQKIFADVGCDSLAVSLTFRADLKGFKVGQVQVWISRKESRSQGFW